MLSSKIIFGFVALCCRSSIALPSVHFPINAQLPPVAVVGQPFLFTFSLITFSSSLNLEYSTEGLPTWLHFEASDRTFIGTPAKADVGDLEFGLVAIDHDGKVTTQVRLEVLEGSLVRANQNAFTKQLAESGNYSAPDTLLLYPDTFFSLDFGPGIFESNGTKLDFYATSEEHAPLPAWLMFDGDSIRFSGTSPALLTPQSSPQTFNFCLIASQSPSFSQAALHFQIAVTNHMLVFANATQTFNISARGVVSIPSLMDQLRYDAKPVHRDQLTSVSSDQPNWLSLDPADLSFYGTAPQEVISTTFRLQVVDESNNVAGLDIQLSTPSLNSKNRTAVDLGSLTLTVGQWFDHTLVEMSSILSEKDTEVDIDFGLAASWLTFQRANASIQGFVPSIPESNTTSITATITDNGEVVRLYSLTLVFDNTTSGTTDGNTSNGIMDASPTLSNSGTPAAEPNDHHNHLQKRYLALVIVLPIALVLLVFLAAILLIRRQRKRSVRELALHQSMQGSTRSSSPNVLVIGAGNDSHSDVQTWPRPPSLQPQLTIPWAQDRPPTRRPWPFAGNRTSDHPQIRSSWDEMLREIGNSHSQSSHDENRQSSGSSSDLTETSVNQNSSRFDTDDDNVPEDLLTSLDLSDRKSKNQIRPYDTASLGGFNGRRLSGLGHGSRVVSSTQHSERATLRQVSLSPLSGSPPPARLMHRLDLIEEPFMSRFRDVSDTKGVTGRPVSNMKSFGRSSISIGSSGPNECDKSEVQRTNQHMRKRTSSTPFSGSLWEDDDCTTEDSASNLGNWRAQRPHDSTSHIPRGFCREGSAIRRWEDESVRGEAGLTSNAISMRSQQTQGSHPNSLRFI